MRLSTIAGLVLAIAHQVLAQDVINPINQSTFDNVIEYTRFARASYANNCALPPNGSVLLNKISNETLDSHVYVFRWDQAQQIVVAYRGTASPQNLVSDVEFALTPLTIPGTNCPSCFVHQGIQTLYNGVANEVLAATKAALAAAPGYSLIVTGHSLGGALASMGTAAFGANGLDVAETYTYGELRNGNQAWGTYVTSFVPDSRYFRVTHANDGVPNLPPVLFGFIHHGIEYWEKELALNNTVATTVQCLPGNGLEPLHCNLGTTSDTPIDEAHLTYSNAITGNTLHVHDCGAPYP